MKIYRVIDNSECVLVTADPKKALDKVIELSEGDSRHIEVWDEELE